MILKQVKSYRPIALLNTIGKAMESIMAQRISYLADRYGLLPETHFGGRRGASAEHAIHLKLEKVNDARRAGQVPSLLLLDVAGAFNFVSRTRLLHNLRKRRLDDKVIKWITSFLSGRE